MSPAILVPTKSFVNAKKRLHPILGPNERRQLAEAMFKDVLGQLVLLPVRTPIFVVTGDPQVSCLASAFGVNLLREKEERGETQAVHFALWNIKKRGIDAVLIIPSDIPLIKASDIFQVMENRKLRPTARIVPSLDRRGTNALFMAPPDLIPPRFGYESFAYHLNRLRQFSLDPEVLENDRIGLDIDEPKDLHQFMERAVEGESYRLLSRVTLGNRALPLP